MTTRSIPVATLAADPALLLALREKRARVTYSEGATTYEVTNIEDGGPYGRDRLPYLLMRTTERAHGIPPKPVAGDFELDVEVDE